MRVNGHLLWFSCQVVICYVLMIVRRLSTSALGCYISLSFDIELVEVFSDICEVNIQCKVLYTTY